MNAKIKIFLLAIVIAFTIFIISTSDPFNSRRARDAIRFNAIETIPLHTLLMQYRMKHGKFPSYSIELHESMPDKKREKETAPLANWIYAGYQDRYTLCRAGLDGDVHIHGGVDISPYITYTKKDGTTLNIWWWEEDE